MTHNFAQAIAESNARSEPVREARQTADVWAELAAAPGSINDTVIDLAGWGPDYPLSGFTLYISARGGIRVEHLYTAPKPYLVSIPLPEGCTAGRRMSALIDRPLPALILGRLRDAAGADKFIGREDREKIDLLVVRRGLSERQRGRASPDERPSATYREYF
jgi:hypothetical protein